MDQAAETETVYRSYEREREEGVNAFRGLLWGTLLSLPIWALIGLGIWALTGMFR